MWFLLLAFLEKGSDVLGDTKATDSGAPGRQEVAMYVLPFPDAA